MEEQRLRDLIGSLVGVSYKDWQVIEQAVNSEFKRLANKNTFVEAELTAENILLELR
ncbi:hypothetical protein P5G65_04815 [Paenibacillus chondroitinus]|uniref:Uncharacterized protein n=1 Tax=Paenibacillus chondroitinus TaxID=59842 RepID=A0ABU6D7E6_9BACL|nr:MULTISPECIES: hypothetical protein [Paenibacillus]MCY9658131.1 hypothetical protein [Paenibacillus anseongense]MEB4793207.1 hypothetical protein [Paenibacillus chondroitinus]